MTSTRLVSLSRRSIAAIEYQVEVTDDLGDLYVAVQSDLLANEAGHGTGEDDPRSAAALAKPLQSELAVARGRRAVLVHRTKRSRLRVAAGMDHVLEIPDTSTEDIEASGDLARYTLAARILPGGGAQADQVPRLRLVVATVGRRGPRPGGGGAGDRQAGRLGPAGP